MSKLTWSADVYLGFSALAYTPDAGFDLILAKKRAAGR